MTRSDSNSFAMDYCISNKVQVELLIFQFDFCRFRTLEGGYYFTIKRH